MEKLEYRNTQSSLSIISILIENISIIFHVSVYFINTEISFSKKYYDPPLRSNNSKKFFKISKTFFPRIVHHPTTFHTRVIPFQLRKN